MFSKKILLIVCMSAAWINLARAQDPDERDLDRRVDVSREYMPDMDRAAKLTIQPLMNDTVTLRPELEYTVIPTPWYTGFGVAAINPVRIDAARFEELLPFYLKAGFGVPSRSILDLYGTTTGTGGGYAGGYINHKGQWSKLRNDIDLKDRALESHNSLGVFGRTWLSNRIALSAELGYDYDIYSRYGYISKADPADPGKSELVSYSVPRAAIVIGNDFTDLSFFNFAVGAEGYMMKDRQDAKETGLKAEIAIGKRFNIYQFMLSANYEGAFGGGVRDGYDISLLSVKPSYRITGKVIDIGAGVEIAYSKMKDEDSKTFFLPSVAIELKVDRAFRIFADLKSETVSNSYRSVTSRNPYITNSYWGVGYIHPERNYKAVAGIRGDISSNFSYEVRAGGGIVRDVLYYYYLGDGTGNFQTFTDKKLKYFTAGASLTGRISENFSAGLEADYFNYSPKNVEYVLDRPEFVGDVYFRYNHRDRIFVKLRGGLQGTRYFGIYDISSVVVGDEIYVSTLVDFEKQKAVFNLGLEGEYRLNKNFGVWLSADNLLNSKLYPYYHYRGFGISLTAGIKLMF